MAPDPVVLGRGCPPASEHWYFSERTPGHRRPSGRGLGFADGEKAWWHRPLSRQARPSCADHCHPTATAFPCPPLSLHLAHSPLLSRLPGPPGARGRWGSPSSGASSSSGFGQPSTGHSVSLACSWGLMKSDEGLAPAPISEPGLLTCKGALRQVTSRGGLLVNSYVGRSQRAVVPQAHGFSSDRLTFALSQPRHPPCVSGHRGSHTFEVSGRHPGRARDPVSVLQGHPGRRSPPPRVPPSSAPNAGEKPQNHRSPERVGPFLPANVVGLAQINSCQNPLQVRTLRWSTSPWRREAAGLPRVQLDPASPAPHGLRSPRAAPACGWTRPHTQSSLFSRRKTHSKGQGQIKASEPQ